MMKRLSATGRSELGPRTPVGPEPVRRSDPRRGTRVVSVLVAAAVATGCLDDELDPVGHFQTSGPQEDRRPTPAGDSNDEQTDGTWRPSLDGRTSLPDLDVFIALQRDFVSFTEWNRLDIAAGPHVLPDETGPRRVYVNVLPQGGEREFAVGTIIVKTVSLGSSPTSWQAHGMVKRGGEFNSRGAYGWEFFDLSLDDDSRPTLQWRGEEPPEGERYRLAIIGSDGEETVVDQACNDCHVSSANDAVLTPQLDLERFQ